MKLYIRLGHEWSDGAGLFKGKQFSAYPAVYGPFEDKNEALADMAKRWPNDKEARCVLFEGSIVKVPGSPLEKPEAEKRAPGDERNWMKKDDVWHCKTCQARVMAVNVAHPIHDGPFPGSGSGQCDYVEVGYCPNCETKPSFHGAPITP